MTISLTKKRGVTFDLMNVLWKTTMDPAFQRFHGQTVPEVPVAAPVPATAATAAAAAPPPLLSPPSFGSLASLNRQETKFFSMEGIYEEHVSDTEPGSPQLAMMKKTNSADALPFKTPKPSIQEDDSQRPPTPVEDPRAVAVVTPELPSLGVTPLPAPEYSKPEKIYRKKIVMETISTATGKGSGPPSPIQEHAALTKSNSLGNTFSLSRKDVVASAKEAGKAEKEKADKTDKVDKVEKGTLDSHLQRIVLNDVYHVSAEKLFNDLFGPQPTLQLPGRSATSVTPWEEKDGAKVRIMTFTETVKLVSKDKDNIRYQTLKVREPQQVIAESAEYTLSPPPSPFSSEMLTSTSLCLAFTK